MIYFVLARSNSITIKNYLNFRGEPLRGKVDIIYYDNLNVLENLKCSMLIFSDFDRLNKKQLHEVIQIYKEIEEKYPSLVLLNNPSKVLLRYDFLRQLFKLGINPYNVYRVTENFEMVKYPVFLREENNHTGALSGLIFSEKELRKNVLALAFQGYPKKSLLIVEYVNVATSEGIFKKYSALKVKDEVFPRQVDYNLHWMVKTSVQFNKYPKQAFLAEFESYMEKHPHKKWLTDIFDISGIEYGRIDYGMLNDKPVIWEINLNPDYGGQYHKKKKKDPVVNRLRDEFHTKLRTKFLENNSAENVTLNLNLSEKTIKIMQPNWWTETKRAWHNKLTTKKPFLKKLLILMRSFFLVWAGLLLFVVRPFQIQTKK